MDPRVALLDELEGRSAAAAAPGEQKRALLHCHENLSEQQLLVRLRVMFRGLS